MIYNLEITLIFSPIIIIIIIIIISALQAYLYRALGKGSGSKYDINNE